MTGDARRWPDGPRILSPSGGAARPGEWRENLARRLGVSAHDAAELVPDWGKTPDGWEAALRVERGAVHSVFLAGEWRTVHGPCLLRVVDGEIERWEPPMRPLLAYGVVTQRAAERTDTPPMQIGDLVCGILGYQSAALEAQILRFGIERIAYLRWYPDGTRELVGHDGEVLAHVRVDRDGYVFRVVSEDGAAPADHNPFGLEGDEP